MAEPTTQTNKPFNRWIIVGAAMLVQFALGALYSYSFLQTAVEKFFDPSSLLIAGERKTLGLMPFAFALLFFAILMIPAGRWQDKAGPKKVAMTGSIVLLAGMLLAAVVSLSGSGDVWGITLTFGMIGGAGIGLTYVCPIACATKWFPDKVGLINGLAVAGFGAGSILFNFLYFYLTSTLSTAFLVCGLIIGGMCFAGAIFLRNPPQGYKPAGWEPPAPKAGVPVVVENWTTKEMVHTKTFYLLWVMYLCSAICGLMVIGNFKPYGVVVGGGPTANLGALINSISIYIAAIAGFCNATGRIFWGKMLDKIGGIKTMRIMFVVQAGAMIMFGLAGVVVGAEFAFWAIFGNLVYFCFGGNLSLFPATTRKFYGPKNMGLNYGVVFSAYGVAGITGALLASPLLTALGGSFTGYFILFGCMSLIAFFVSFITKTPERKAA